MTSPTSLARKIASKLYSHPLQDENIQIIAAALVEFGEAEYRRGREELAKEYFEVKRECERNQERSENPEAGK